MMTSLVPTLVQTLFLVLGVIALPLPVIAGGLYHAPPGNAWVQVESHPDLVTALNRARFYSKTYDHTAAFSTESGWYAIAIGIVPRDRADDLLTTLKAVNAVPEDSLLTTGRTYLVQVWPPDTESIAGNLNAAIALEQSWSVEIRKGVQNALIWSGNYNGVVDGVIGPATRAAIRNFQRQNGFPATGYLTGNEIAVLEAARVAAVDAAGFRVIEDYESGIRIGLPLGMFRRGETTAPVVEFDPLPGRPAAFASLFSLWGDKVDFRGIFGMMKREAGPDPYAVVKEGWFVVSGTNDGWSTYAYGWAGYGAIKGFLLGWPSSMEQVFRPISVAMYNSFEPIPGIVLDAGAVSGNTATMSDEVAPDAPASDTGVIATGTGFVVDGAGRILTNAHVIEGCTSIGIGQNIPAYVIAANEGVDLALIQTESGSWPAFARFAARPARLNTDVTVLGYPLHGLLGGLNVTRGSVSAGAGLGNDPLRFQITAAVQPGNSGGPVLNRQGAVVGVVQSKLDAVVVADVIGDIPQNVNFAIRGSAAMVFLAQHGVKFELAGSGETLAPAELAEQARRYTVLVRCLAQ